jgi:hypothetical protein
MMTFKPYYVLIVAISLMGGSASAQTLPIPGRTLSGATVSIHVDTETGVEYIVSTNTNAITPRLCVTDRGALGTVARYNGSRTCIPNR